MKPVILLSNSFPFCFVLFLQLFELYAAQVHDPDWTFSEFIPETYDKTPPIHANHQPINVSVVVKVEQLIAVNEGEQSFTIDLTYIQKWPDHRLKFPPLSNKSIPMDMSLMSKLWIPSVYMTNSLNPNMLQLTPLFLEIDANSSQIILTARQVVKLKCLMNLWRFPMDSQTCPIEFTLCKCERKVFTNNKLYIIILHFSENMTFISNFFSLSS